MKQPWGSRVVGAALIVSMAVVAYIPAMRGGFIWDDSLLVLDNQLVKTADGLCRIWQAFDIPVTYTAFWMEWHLWGGNPLGYHTVNVMLHALNAVMLWRLLAKLKIPGAWLASAVFTLHPVNVASVAWISEQKNTLSMFFYLVTIFAYLRFEEKDQWRWYGFSLVAFLLALLSKTAVVMLPFVLLGCQWWLRNRITRKDWICASPFFALSTVFGLATIWFVNRALGGHSARTAGFLSRLATAGWAPWFYLYKALVPFNLNVIYPQWNINVHQAFSYIPGIALVGCLILFYWNRKSWGRPLYFGIGYFVIVLFPVLGFFDQTFHEYSLVADHWQYFSVIGIAALAVAAGVSICRRIGEHGSHVRVVVGLAVLIVLGMATRTRARLYGDAEALWRDTISRNPNTWVAHNNLGNALYNAGKIQDAMPFYEQAVRLAPKNYTVQNNLGMVLSRLGKTKEAITHLEQAIQLLPDSAEAHDRLWEAQTPATQKKMREVAYVHYNLGLAFARAGRLQDAIAHYESALRIRPDIIEAHIAYGNALVSTDKIKDAIAHYEQALRAEPNEPELNRKLAWLLATAAPTDGGDPVRALYLAQWACELTGNRKAEYLGVLAASYAAAGRCHEAISTAQEAIDFGRSAAQSELVDQMQAHLEAYRASCP